ncbi:hypothetical protein HOG48_05370 [Candidatus Peregrinibacteria bacterium]|jgi:hypothetical protein|nr:hypothetical protein [Candidatus Peregrinibacteria bacterium]
MNAETDGTVRFELSYRDPSTGKDEVVDLGLGSDVTVGAAVEFARDEVMGMLESMISDDGETAHLLPVELTVARGELGMKVVDMMAAYEPEETEESGDAFSSSSGVILNGMVPPQERLMNGGDFINYASV